MMNILKKNDGREERLTGNRNFMMLLAAQLVSNLGEWLYLVALLTLVGLKWSATPWEITAITLCMAIPVLAFGPAAGVIGDRFDRKKLMIASDLVRSGILIGILLSGSLWQIYVLLVLKGLMDVLFSPAKTGKVKEVVPQHHLEMAVTISSSTEQIMKIVGPALGGLVMAVFGIEWCFVITSITFLVSAALLLGVRGKRKTAADETSGASKAEGAGLDQESGTPSVPGSKSSFLKDIKAGLSVISGIPLLSSGLLMLCAVLLVMQMADTQTVTLFRMIPGVSDDLLGYCISASGFGTLLAALLARKISWGTLSKMAAGAVVTGLVFAASAVAVVSSLPEMTVYVILFSAFLLAGLGAGFVFIPFQVLLMKRTPEHLTSRVFGTVGSLTSAAVIMGPMLGGVMVTAWGPVFAFIVSGLGTSLLGVLFFLFKGRIQRKDPLPVHAELQAPAVRESTL
ncbi:MFS transporter [Paenibacillus sp. DMB20]|uniref:MFS transporter n=1 Tax=Paenibacillus sp. DMB20 TaxID=1642570 RepID=UPI00062748F8|nr:MFS transporter [Paenibacillus sp. DMB20]KKO50831.1 MFS transporter [Paenibacillus sp. DMB20]